MKPMPQFPLRVLTASLIFAFAFPAHAAPLALSQIPPAVAIPPPPNILVTLDDSGSMNMLSSAALNWGAHIAYNPSLTYNVPPGPNGVAIRTASTAPMAFDDGLTTGTVNLVNLTNKADVMASHTTYGTTQNDSPLTFNAAARDAYAQMIVDGYTSAADKQNYVNWYGFYRIRTLAMKSSVMEAFKPGSIPDDEIRLAWQALNGNCRGFPSASPCPAPNTMWTLSDTAGSPVRTHRTNFYNWVRNVDANGGTPLRAAYRRAGEYFLTTGVNSPWSSMPGVTQAPERQCRRSYQIMFTDGGHNESDLAVYGNSDNTNVTLPDGVAYTQQRPYKGPTGAAGNLTLADVAFHYWSTDLQTGAAFTNDLNPINKVSGNEPYGSASVVPYWNPKNNPASWQHLVTYGIGFGQASNIPDPVWAGNTTAGPQFASVVDGTKEWPNTITVPIDDRAVDLWHAAVNSRGQMYPANDQSALTAAFKNILADINGNSLITVGAASSLAAVSSDFTVVRAGYLADPLRADIQGYDISAGGIISTTPAWVAQTVVGAQSPGSRVVLTATAPTTGSPFRWASLSPLQQTSLNETYTSVVDGFGANRVDFLRGATNKEASPANAPLDSTEVLRNRQGYVIGTVANAEPRIVQAPRSGYIASSYRAFRSSNLTRTPIVYVGTNDGMLHGLRTVDGQEVLGYVPRGVYSNLPFYTDPAYTHNMYVDGPIISSDYEESPGVWKTILVGGLGAGGRGIFALDVTNPTSFSETNAASLVKFDYTGPTVLSAAATAQITTDAVTYPFLGELLSDMGHVFGDPSRDSFIGRNLQIAKMQNGKWALIIGNGANSVNERGALYIIYLDGTGFKKILVNTAMGTGNGLAIPLPVDVNGDGLTDTVYAGDLLGRMWKFDLSSGVDTNWKVAETAGVAQPIIATGRPITSAPAVALHPQGGLLVTFGTGRQLVNADSSSTALESIYGIWDKPGGPHNVAVTDLVLRELDAASALTNSGADARVLTGGVATAINYGLKRGWKMDLLLSKEKVVFNPITDGQRAFYSTSIPQDSAACQEIPGGSFLAFDAINGAEPPTVILDINNSAGTSVGTFESGDQVSGKSTMGRKAPVGRLVGIVSPPPPPVCPPAPAVCPAPPPAACGNAPANLAVGAQAQICISKYSGPGRRLWRDLRP